MGSGSNGAKLRPGRWGQVQVFESRKPMQFGVQRLRNLQAALQVESTPLRGGPLKIPMLCSIISNSLLCGLILRLISKSPTEVTDYVSMA